MWAAVGAGHLRARCGDPAPLRALAGPANTFGSDREITHSGGLFPPGIPEQEVAMGIRKIALPALLLCGSCAVGLTGSDAWMSSVSLSAAPQSVAQGQPVQLLPGFPAVGMAQQIDKGHYHWHADSNHQKHTQSPAPASQDPSAMKFSYSCSYSYPAFGGRIGVRAGGGGASPMHVCRTPARCRHARIGRTARLCYNVP